MTAMGPVLHFRGCDAESWRLSALVVAAADQAPALATADGPQPARRLADHAGETLWRFDFALPRHRPDAQWYAIGDQRIAVAVPAPGEALHIAFVSCNGDADLEPGGDSGDRFERWRHLTDHHAAAPLHLMLQGGDQLYADTVWQAAPELAAWRKQWPAKRRRMPFGDALRDAADDFYWRLYTWLWSLPDLAPALARVPSLMMWDDHDIFDGWGSYADGDQACPIFQGLWRSARRHFRWFQQADGSDGPDPHQFGWARRIDDVGIIAPDLRSTRSRRQVLDDESWQWFSGALDGLAGCRRLFVVMTVPLVNADLSPVERPLVWVPGQQLYQDDLRDQWLSYAHREEWTRVVRRLLAIAASGTAVTVLSGEIHLGAYGRVRDPQSGAELHQITASGIAHEPQPQAMTWLLERVFSSPRRRAGLAVEMMPIPGLGRRYLAARNWLSMTVADDAFTAEWHAAGDAPPQMVASL